MESTLKKTARSWDSFRKTLCQVLDIIKPKTVFEYGPGVSTQIICQYPSVEIIDSIEHDPAWYGKWRWTMPDKVNLMLHTNMELYPYTRGRVEKYDLIFIDGREREKCLREAKNRLVDGGVVMLHDAERVEYREMVNEYDFKFWTDNGSTVTLTDNMYMAAKLEGVSE